LDEIRDLLSHSKVILNLAFQMDKNNKDWENSVEARQQSAGGMQATTSTYSEQKTRTILTNETQIIMKYISENIKPLALIAICGCVGYFLGSPMTGMVVGITIVASVTLLL